MGFLSPKRAFVKWARPKIIDVQKIALIRAALAAFNSDMFNFLKRLKHLVIIFS
jgi:hypothetical protein